MPSSHDVIILGGGLAGLTLAIQLRQKMPKARILVLEKLKHPVPEATHKVGESCVEVSAHYFANVLGLRAHILEEQLPKLGLRFFFSRNGNQRIEDRIELGGTRYPPAPSYQLDRGRFENHLAELCLKRGIEFLDEVKVTGVDFKRGREPHSVSTVKNGSFTAKWIVDASGRAGILKKKLGLQRPSPHRANAVWFRVDEKINVDDWCDLPSWREGHDGELSRWFSTNHLMGRGYWVWLIPLASGSTSVGIVADDKLHDLRDFNSVDKALGWLAKNEPQCASRIKKEKIQDFLALKNYSHESKQVFSASGWGLTGEAGYFLDPFYSPGSDFIAFGNTFLCDLICRSMRGKSNLFQARYYDWLYKTCYEGTLQCYNGQYPLFGNPEVMSVKIMWDYMVYWTITGYLFFHDRMCEPLLQGMNCFKLMRIGKLNREMQKFFRHWDEQGAAKDIVGKVNMSQIELIYQTNLSLLDTLSDREFSKRFSDNVKIMERFFWEIIDNSDVEADVKIKRKGSVSSETPYLQHVYEVFSPGEERKVANA